MLDLGCEPWQQDGGDKLGLQSPAEDVLPQTMFDKFYDLDYERNRAFKTGSEGLAVARRVLYERKKSDVPFLRYLLQRSLVENPECEVLRRPPRHHHHHRPQCTRVQGA